MGEPRSPLTLANAGRSGSRWQTEEPGADSEAPRMDDVMEKLRAEGIPVLPQETVEERAHRLKRKGKKSKHRSKMEETLRRAIDEYNKDVGAKMDGTEPRKEKDKEGNVQKKNCYDPAEAVKGNLSKYFLRMSTNDDNDDDQNKYKKWHDNLTKVDIEKLWREPGDEGGFDGADEEG